MNLSASCSSPVKARESYIFQSHKHKETCKGLYTCIGYTIIITGILNILAGMKVWDSFYICIPNEVYTLYLLCLLVLASIFVFFEYFVGSITRYAPSNARNTKGIIFLAANEFGTDKLFKMTPRNRELSLKSTESLATAPSRSLRKISMDRWRIEVDAR
jgi:hypothetical protein